MRKAWLAVVLVVACGCGGSSKKTEEPAPAPAAPVEPAPAESTSAEPGAAPVGQQPVGVFDCKSGVAECDELFGKTVMCVRSANGLDEVTRAQYVDEMQKACLQVKEAAGNKDALPQVVQACKDGLASLEQQKAQMQCSF
jgi:hypothetical protein